jgi:hypothetical protein
MKGQFRIGLKFAAVLFAAATLGFAVPNVTASAPAQRLGVPGTVNYVEGQVSVNGQPLGTSAVGNTVVQPNQAVNTQNGYVEVLLTPGAFLRIGNNSEIVMQSLGLANIQLQVARGQAMVEVADLVKDSVMQINMSGATTQIEKRGLYEFDANQQLVRVLDGKAKVLEASRVKTIGKGNQVVLSSANLKSHGFDKQVAQADPLYVWSAARSQAEAQANVQLASNIAVNGGWYGPGWYWDPFWADYAFLPGAGFLYSPFGWGFYSPGFVWAAPVYVGHGFYGRGIYAHGWHGGVAAGVHTGVHPYAGGFRGGFAGGFHGGFHGGGRR